MFPANWPDDDGPSHGDGLTCVHGDHHVSERAAPQNPHEMMHSRVCATQRQGSGSLGQAVSGMWRLRVASFYELGVLGR